MRSVARVGMLLLALFLCGASAKYSVRRSAVVPAMAPPGYSGQPLAGPVQVGVQNSTVVVPVEPVEAEGANAGLYIARTNVGGDVRLRFTPNFDLGPVFEYGPESGAMPVATDMPDKPHQGGACGAGIAMNYSAATANPRLRVGIGLHLLGYSIPYFEQGTCVDNCTYENQSYQETGRHTVPVFSLAVVPSYRIGRTSLYGGLTVRNHPSNIKGSVQDSLANAFDDGAEVNSGPANLVAAAGAEVTLTPGVTAYAQLAQPLTADPVVYGPSVGVGLAASFGEGTLIGR